MSSSKFGRAAVALACATPLALLALLAPTLADACACGCGVFDVGDGSIMPNDANSGFSAWFRYSYMDQNQNWEGASKAPASDNDDKGLNTSFYTVGGQYVISRAWTVMAELPIYNRAFTTTDDDGTVNGPAGSIYTAHLTAPGDLQISAMYTGFSPDLTTGVSFGLKLPTGRDKSPDGVLGGPEFDRDSLPGTGSTDIMVGAYHVGALSSDGKLSYFVQARYQVAVAIYDDYRPGNEFDSALALNYNLGSVGPFARVTPGVQLVNSLRNHDTGLLSDTYNSGYERLLIGPTVMARLDQHAHVYANVSVPIYQHTNAAGSLAIEGVSGQLVAPALFTLQFGYDF